MLSESFAGLEAANRPRPSSRQHTVRAPARASVSQRGWLTASAHGEGGCSPPCSACSGLCRGSHVGGDAGFRMWGFSTVPWQCSWSWELFLPGWPAVTSRARTECRSHSCVSRKQMGAPPAGHHVSPPPAPVPWVQARAQRAGLCSSAWGVPCTLTAPASGDFLLSVPSPARSRSRRPVPRLRPATSNANPTFPTGGDSASRHLPAGRRRRRCSWFRRETQGSGVVSVCHSSTRCPVSHFSGDV